jgi:hypothetical protein
MQKITQLPVRTHWLNTSRILLGTKKKLKGGCWMGVNYDHQKSWMQAFMSFDGKNHNFFLLLFLKPQHNENSSERKALSEQS